MRHDMNVWRKRWPGETALNRERLEYGLPNHVAPYSCLVACMGNSWQPGCFEAVSAMCGYTAMESAAVEMYEEHQRCFFPYDGLGLMRDAALFRAIQEGWEYLCYVDNDVQPPKDAILKLMRRRVPIVMPYIEYADGADHGIKSTTVLPNQGLALISSTVISMVVIQTRVMLPWALSGFWQNPLGADEAYHFAKLANAGHNPFLDTDVQVKCVKPPTYPLDWPAGFKKRYRDFLAFVMDPATDTEDKHPLDGGERRKE